MKPLIETDALRIMPLNARLPLGAGPTMSNAVPLARRLYACLLMPSLLLPLPLCSKDRSVNCAVTSTDPKSDDLGRWRQLMLRLMLRFRSVLGTTIVFDPESSMFVIESLGGASRYVFSWDDAQSARGTTLRGIVPDIVSPRELSRGVPCKPECHSYGCRGVDSVSWGELPTEFPPSPPQYLYPEYMQI